MTTRTLCPVALVSCLLLTASVAWGDDPSWPNNPDAPVVVGGNNAFAFDLYRALAQQEEGNLLLSPYSISTALAMTYAGARGNTEAQMADVLHFTLPQERLHPALADVIANLNDGQRTGYQLSVANRLWGQEGCNFLPEFLSRTQQHYGAELAQVDFIGNTEQTRQTINHWVEAQTQDKIQDLISPGVLSQLTRLVLTNAVYFKGDWRYRFDPDLTEEAPFDVAPGEQSEVSMMHQVSELKCAAFPSFKMLELPYTGEELSMLALLPNETHGLADLEAWLTAETLDQSLEQLVSRDVSVFLPKFEIASEFELTGVLASMGMPEAFIPGAADFSGMDGTRNLFVSDVVHKGFANVSEEGTEAAAATGVVVSLGGTPPEFRADHPFLFLIRDNTTESILFMGRMTSPSDIVSVPEPSTFIGLLSMGTVGLLAYGRRRRKQTAEGPTGTRRAGVHGFPVPRQGQPHDDLGRFADRPASGRDDCHRWRTPTAPRTAPEQLL